MTELITSEEEARSYVEGWAADDAAKARLHQYAAMLLAENQRQNLISRASEEHLWVRHMADSAQLLEHVSRETLCDEVPGPWLDLGTGPGLPGLVIAILAPQIPVVLVESRARRVAFLEQCVSELGLKNCTVEGYRLEVLKPFESWVISARAFAPLEKLLRLSSSFSTEDTRYLLPKGRSAEQELKESKPAIRKMFHVKHSLTDSDARIIVSK